MKTEGVRESFLSHCPDPPKTEEGVSGLSWMKPGRDAALSVAQLSQQKGEL